MNSPSLNQTTKMPKRFRISISLPEIKAKQSPGHLILILMLLLCSLAHDLPAQSKFSKYAGVFFTGDAQMYYTGPSVLIGSDFQASAEVTVGMYGQYFEKDFGDHGYQSWTLAALAQLYVGKKKQFYIAAGVAWQRALEHDDLYPDVIDRSIIIPSYRFGRHLVFKKYALSPELNLTGPYSYNGGSSTELFTQTSLGLRIHLFYQRLRRSALHQQATD